MHLSNFRMTNQLPLGQWSLAQLPSNTHWAGGNCPNDPELLIAQLLKGRWPNYPQLVIVAKVVDDRLSLCSWLVTGESLESHWASLAQ